MKVVFDTNIFLAVTGDRALLALREYKGVRIIALREYLGTI